MVTSTKKKGWYLIAHFTSESGLKKFNDIYLGLERPTKEKLRSEKAKYRNAMKKKYPNAGKMSFGFADRYYF